MKWELCSLNDLSFCLSLKFEVFWQNSNRKIQTKYIHGYQENAYLEKCIYFRKIPREIDNQSNGILGLDFEMIQNNKKIFKKVLNTSKTM